MHRLFVALRPPAPVRTALADVMEGIAGARWQDDDQLHLTLRYVGEVETPLAEEIAHALAAVRAPAPTLTVAGTGTFDRRGVPDAVWAGVTPRDAVTALHRKVDAALVRLGLPPEGRAYLPHITLARLPRSAGPVAPFLAATAGLAGPSFTATRFHLYESRLGHGGAHYEIVATYPLDA